MDSCNYTEGSGEQPLLIIFGVSPPKLPLFLLSHSSSLFIFTLALEIPRCIFLTSGDFDVTLSSVRWWYNLFSDSATFLNIVPSHLPWSHENPSRDCLGWHNVFVLAEVSRWHMLSYCLVRLLMSSGFAHPNSVIHFCKDWRSLMILF